MVHCQAWPPRAYLWHTCLSALISSDGLLPRGFAVGSRWPAHIIWTIMSKTFTKYWAKYLQNIYTPQFTFSMLTHWRTWPGREQSCYFCPQPRPRMGPVWTPIWACGSGGAGRGARSHSILVAAPLGLPPPLCLKSLLHAILSAGRKWGFKRCGENVLSHDLSKTFNSKRDFPLGCIRINFLALCSKAH